MTLFLLSRCTKCCHGHHQLVGEGAVQSCKFCSDLVFILLSEGLQGFRSDVSTARGSQPLEPGDALASIDIKAAVETRPFVVLRLHDVAGSYKSDGDHDGVWICGCKPCNSGFAWKKKRSLHAL